MGLIASIIILLLAFVAFRQRKRWYAPDVFFLFMWSVITFFSYLHLYGMYETNDSTYLIVLIGCISYMIGCSYGYKLNIKDNYALHRSEFIFTPRFFWVASIVLFLLQLSPFIKTYALVSMGVELSEVRSDFFDQSQSSLDVIIGVLTSLLGPIVQISGIVFLLKDFRKNFICLFPIVILALMESVISGGRFGIAHILLEVVVCYYFLRQNTKTNVSIKKVVLYALVFAFVSVIVFITSMRGIESDSAKGHYYVYLCGCVKYFDLQLQALNNSSFYPLGSALWGLWYILFRIFHSLGFSYPDWYLYIGTNMNTAETFPVGDEMRINAFSTPFYHLYFDMGWIGVIIGMFVLGLFASYVYKRALKCPSTPNLVFFILVIQMLFMTIFSYPLVNNGNVLIILYMFFTRRLI